jgi:hypothetical protein
MDWGKLEQFRAKWRALVKKKNNKLSGSNKQEHFLTRWIIIGLSRRVHLCSTELDILNSREQAYENIIYFNMIRMNDSVNFRNVLYTSEVDNYCHRRVTHCEISTCMKCKRC